MYMSLQMDDMMTSLSPKVSKSLLNQMCFCVEFVPLCLCEFFQGLDFPLTQESRKM